MRMLGPSLHGFGVALMFIVVGQLVMANFRF